MSYDRDREVLSRLEENYLTEPPPPTGEVIVRSRCTQVLCDFVDACALAWAYDDGEVSLYVEDCPDCGAALEVDQ